MGESSSEELSRELSNLSFISNASDAISSTTESRKSGHNAETVDSTSTDVHIDESGDEKGTSISRGSTEVSIPGKHSSSESDATDILGENSSSVSNDKLDNHRLEVEDSEVDHRDSSQEGSNSLAEKKKPSREKKESSVSENEHKSQSSRKSTSASSSQLSRDTSKMSEQYDSSIESDVLSRENTMSADQKIYVDDFETSRENTMTNSESYGDDFNDSSDSREQSFTDHQDNEDVDEIEKENSVLIERDGKFELINKNDLEADELEMLGLPSMVETKEKLSIKDNRRPVSSTNKKPEFAHVTSAYALSETQREMKKRRISVRHMRVNEEKQRLMEEEERQRIANEKSYRKWLLQKSAATHRQSKKELAEAAANEERRKLADKSYNLWLKEKEQKQKEERKIEKIRLADEAEHYIVRDRVMCERSFRLWLKQKKQEDNVKMPIIEKPRKKSAVKKKQKSSTTQEQKPQSVVHPPKLKAEEERRQSLTKLNKKMSKVRYADMFGYRHPPSIDDLITYTR